jgi:hypothetical protein
LSNLPDHSDAVKPFLEALDLPTGADFESG